MFVSDKLIYLHLQKTGGTHVTKLLSRYLPAERGKQVMHGSLPAGYVKNSKYVVGSIRNPWDWYVSLWAYGCEGRGAFIKKLTEKKYGRYINRLGSNPVVALQGIWNEYHKPRRQWTALFRDGKDTGLFREWLRLLLSSERKYDIGPEYAGSKLSSYAGAMTYCYIGIYTGGRAGGTVARISSAEELAAYDREHNILDDIIRTESLHDDLLRVIGVAGYVLDAEQIEGIRNAGKTKTSTRHSVGKYYDNETLDLVMEKERFLIEKYDYRPPALAGSG
ncbi:MAG TPA: hypothetical protein DCO71_02085 [Gammaproteobacteria bacterium]|nr:hypothetical protein [Gammaproteobacteria bacterium]